ncbi:hypothetical protein QOT17_008079 [Balamuthia mandrillaris]
MANRTPPEAEGLPHFPFLELPSELQLHTLVWLAPLAVRSTTNGSKNINKDLFHCHLVCKHFAQLLRRDYFWQMVLQTSGVVEEGFPSLPHDVQTWKELYQLQFIHLEVANGSDKYLRLEDKKLTVTVTGTHYNHFRVYASRDWHSGKHYWEAKFNHINAQIFVGVLPSKICNTYTGIIGHSTSEGWSIIPYTGEIRGNHGKDSKPPLQGFQWFKEGDVLGVCLDIDAGKLDYWCNGVYLTGLQKETIKQNGPYRAAVSLMNDKESVTFNFNARVPASAMQREGGAV